MKKSKIVILIILMITITVLVGCSQTKKPAVSGEKVREYANALYNRELYQQAVDEYQHYLDTYTVDNKVRANIHFIMGNIYFERLHDYENALAQYLKVKHLFPQTNLESQINKGIVACLERLQRSEDAKQALDEAASLEHDSVPSRPGAVIAKMGDREITSGDLKYQIGQLPEYIRSQIEKPEDKLEFLQQYIATELFYDAAKRQGLDNNKEVIEGTFQAKKNLMVQKYIENEIASNMDITPEDVEMYYKANKEKYADKDEKGNIKRQKPFSEAKQQVAQDLVREKQQNKYNELIQRMMKTEGVKIYSDRIN
ncbi:MAG: hypothetical protein P8078_06735 [bacterium]